MRSCVLGQQEALLNAMEKACDDVVVQQQALQELKDHEAFLNLMLSETKEENSTLVDERVEWWAEEERLKRSLEKAQDSLQDFRSVKRKFGECQADLEDLTAKSREMEMQNIQLNLKVVSQPLPVVCGHLRAL